MTSIILEGLPNIGLLYGVHAWYGTSSNIERQASVGWLRRSRHPPKIGKWWMTQSFPPYAC